MGVRVGWSRVLPLVLCGLGAGTMASDVDAQSFVGFRALGVPVGPAGGRAIALGNLGIGLAGVEVSATDPTAAAELLLPTVSVSMQPTWGEFALEGQTGSINTTRFPLIGIGYPVLSANGVVNVSLSGYLEQRWVAEFGSINDLGGVQVPTDDRFESDGGISVARLGWTQRIGERFAVGGAAGAYLGRLDQVFGRTLDSLAVGGDVEPFVDGGAWRYSGTNLTLGVGGDPHEVVHVAAALEWSGDVKATPQGETGGDEQVFDIPVRLSAGATARLSPRLHLNTSIVMQDWSSASGFEAGVTSDQSLSFGAGLEWRALQGETRSFPLRVGYRSVALPFRFASENADESIWSVGMGLNLVESEGLRFGWVDMAVERGSRSSAPLDETFWRATFSIGISRF